MAVCDFAIRSTAASSSIKTTSRTRPKHQHHSLIWILSMGAAWRSRSIQPSIYKVPLIRCTRGLRMARNKSRKAPGTGSICSTSKVQLSNIHNNYSSNSRVVTRWEWEGPRRASFLTTFTLRMLLTTPLLALQVVAMSTWLWYLDRLRSKASTTKPAP